MDYDPYFHSLENTAFFPSYNTGKTVVASGSQGRMLLIEQTFIEHLLYAKLYAIHLE